MNKLRSLLFLGIIVLAFTGVSVAQNSSVCNQPWFPNGVSHAQCPEGLEYPTLNAYNDSLFLDPNTTFEEKNFALVRDLDNQTGRLSGFRDQITFTDEDKTYEGYFYVHNSGRPDCNFPANSPQLARNNCQESTILRNVDLQLRDTFRRDRTADGRTILISDGIVDSQNNRRVHTFTADLTTANGDPRDLTDSFTIYTPIDKSIYLNATTFNQICTSFNQTTVNGRVQDQCITSSIKRHDESTLELVNSGIDLTSRYAGGEVTGDVFYASERYIREVKIFMKLTDAPDEQLVCEGITASPIRGNNATSTTQTYRVQFDPNERDFHDAIRVQGASNTTSFSNRSIVLGGRYTDVTLTGLTANSRVTISSAGSSSACSTVLTFPDIPNGQACRDLEIVQVSETENSITFDIDATPSRFESLAEVSTTQGTLEEISTNRYRVTGLDNSTTITAQVPSNFQGSENCNDTLEFTPEPPLVCESITLNTDTYDYKANPRPTFRVTDKQPAGFQADFRWTVVGENNQTIQTTTGDDLLSFRPNSPLTGRETVRVQVVGSDNSNCRAEATSERPPIEEVCEDLELNRRLNPQLKRTIPSNGQPAIFQIDGGSYEGDITFRAEGEPDRTVFITNGQRTRGEITVGIDETVIILNTGEDNVIRVFAQEQNQYTEDCFLTLRADENDEGDKLTEIEKTVDKPFATDGDILTYTIKYTISPVFGSSEFREALEGLDTAVLKDDIKNVFGLQDRLSNPLESRDSSLQVLDLFIDGRLSDSSGDLFNLQEGLTIENLTEKAGNTYTITYTARLDADIIEECQVITDSCGFEFLNTVVDNFNNFDSASVLATCPFVVSRSFGDVFLEEEFEGTIDIARCTNRRNTEGPVFTPKPRTPQELISSGTGALSAPTHRICRESIKENPNLDSRELEGYKNPLANFSSSVCEVSLFTSSSWTSEDIERNLRSNASRFNNVTNLNSTNTLSNLNSSALATYDAINPNSDTKVYRKTNGNLTINNDSPIILNDGLAKTIIIEGNDLIINQNISYQRSTSQAFPSQIAFIVIGGDVVIGPNVTEVVGAIAAVPDADGNGGFLRRSEQTNNLLTIQGSIFGDSGPLFAGTSNPGDLLADRGSVTVIYDSGIILNTPPGLQSIIQFNQYQTVR